jgi:hypothetical protein
MDKKGVTVALICLPVKRLGGLCGLVQKVGRTINNASHTGRIGLEFS